MCRCAGSRDRRLLSARMPGKRLSLERRGCPANSTHAATLGRRLKNSPPAPRRDRCPPPEAVARPRTRGGRRGGRRGRKSGFASSLATPYDPPHGLAAFASRWVHPARRRAGRACTVPCPGCPHNPIEKGRRGISPQLCSKDRACKDPSCERARRRKWGLWERALISRSACASTPPPALGTRGFAMDHLRGGRAHRRRRRGGSWTASLRQRMLARQVPPGGCALEPTAATRSPAGPVKNPRLKTQVSVGFVAGSGSPLGQTPPGQVYH
jgi:hypothetical protein